MLIGFVSVSGIYAQDQQFYQPQLAPLQLNPALAVNQSKYRAHLNYQSQWKSLGTPFTAIAGSFDMRFSQVDKGGLAAGIAFLKDKASGTGSKITTVNGAIGYGVKLTSNSTLSAGLNIGIDQWVYDPADGKWASSFNGFYYDPNLPSRESFAADSESNLDLGGGVHYRLEKKPSKRGAEVPLVIEAGLAAYHLGRIALSESQTLSESLPARYSAHFFIDIPVGSLVAVGPASFFNLQSGSKQVQAGLQAKYNIVSGGSFISPVKPMWISAGTFYRTGKSLIITSSCTWSDYSLGLAYHLNYGQLNEYSSGRGGYELALRWQIKGN